MASVVIALLVICGVLTVKLMGANRDKEDLRKRIEALKRQLLLRR